MESERFEPVRTCRIVRRLRFDTGKDALLVSLTPGVWCGDFNRNEDVTSFILASRYEGTSLASMDEFPCFVFIALPRQDVQDGEESIAAADLDIVGWGELYGQAADASM